MTEWVLILVLLSATSPPDYHVVGSVPFVSEHDCQQAGFTYARERFERTKSVTRWTCYYRLRRSKEVLNGER